MLRGAVREYDQTLFWGSLSVAKFVNYQFPHAFSRRYSNCRLKDVVGMRGARIYSRQLMNTRLIGHYKMLSELADCPSERTKMAFDRLKGRFHVREKKKGKFFPIVDLCSRYDPLGIEFRKWISLLKLPVEPGHEDEFVSYYTPSSPERPISPEPISCLKNILNL